MLNILGMDPAATDLEWAWQSTLISNEAWPTCVLVIMIGLVVRTPNRQKSRYGAKKHHMPLLDARINRTNMKSIYACPHHTAPAKIKTCHIPRQDGPPGRVWYSPYRSYDGQHWGHDVRRIQSPAEASLHYNLSIILER